MDEAVAAIGRVAELDRHGVRAVFERRYTAERMTHDYLALYEKLLEPRPAINGRLAVPSRDGVPVTAGRVRRPRARVKRVAAAVTPAARRAGEVA